MFPVNRKSYGTMETYTKKISTHPKYKYLLKGYEKYFLKFKNNIEATFNLILTAQKRKVKNILIASSMGVDNFEKNPSIYGLTKLVCEKISKTFINVHIAVLIHK